MASASKVTLVLDVETNGIGNFRPVPTQEVVQVGLILGDTVEESFLVQGVHEINPSVPHDISVADCAKQGLTREEACNLILEYIHKSDCIVGHNIAFDLGCLYHTFADRVDELKSAIVHKKIFCTMHGTTQLCKIPFPNARPGSTRYKFPRLEELYEFLFRKKPEAKLHDALEDCRVTLACFKALE